MSNDVNRSDAIRETMGWAGRMLSGSKSGYSEMHPNNIVIFNANLCTATEKLWYGDIDITRDEHKLKNLAALLGETLYILYEMDGRFENEAKPKIERARAIIPPLGKIEIKERTW